MAVFSLYIPIFISFSVSLPFFFSFVLPSLINLFKNNNNTNNHNLHSFLGFSGGLGVISAIGHVILKKPRAPSSSKRDTTADVGVLDIDGLTSCTDSLGFEGSDEGLLDDPVENVDEDCCEGPVDWSRMCNRVRKEAKSFPPPLSSLNMKGQPSFYLRPVRKDGRLELTEVRIHRPEILHAWRHDGRLTLHLMPEESILDDGVEQEQLLAQEEEEIAKLEGEVGQLEQEIVERTTEEEEAEPEEEKQEEFGFGEGGGNEGLRRCHQLVNGQRRRVHGSHDHQHSHPLRMYRLGIA